MAVLKIWLSLLSESDIVNILQGVLSSFGCTLVVTKCARVRLFHPDSVSSDEVSFFFLL